MTLLLALALVPAGAAATTLPANRLVSRIARRTGKRGRLNKQQVKQVIALIKHYAGGERQGPEGKQGPAGSPGTNAIAGPPTGPAGGALAGAYPSPSLAPESVGTGAFAKGAVAPEAALFGGFLPAAFQKRVTGECASGEALRKIDAAGAVTCLPTGTVTSVGAGTGLSGGQITSQGTLSLASSYQLPQSCANGQVAKSNGSNAWSCSNDANSGGTITEITTSGGLTGSGTSGAVNVAADPTKIQTRIAGGGCAGDELLQTVAQDGTPTCLPDHAYLSGNTYATAYPSPVSRSVTVPAGTWLILGKAQAYNGSQVNFACGLIAGGYVDQAGNSTGTTGYAEDSLMAMVTTVESETQVKLQCEGPSGTGISYPQLAVLPLGSVN